MVSKVLKCSLRTDRITLLKLRYIADNNFRTVNKELDKLVKTHIAAFEKEHGEIKILDEYKENVE